MPGPLGWAVLLSCALATAPAAAAGACPTRDAVQSAVRALLERSHAEVDGLEDKFSVEDEGARYSVNVLDRRRSYDDAQRDCRKRAEVAAVFIALTLAPPDIQSPEPPEPEPAAEPEPVPEPAPPIAPPPPPPSPRRAPLPEARPEPSQSGFELELGGRASIAPRSAGTETLLGGEASIAATRGQWAIKALFGYGSSIAWELSQVSLQERRFALGLSLRREWGAGSWRALAEVGPTVHVLALRQASPEAAPSESLSQWGLRGAATRRFDSRLSPYASILLDILPFGREIRVQPNGRLGTTSGLWLGTSIGLVAKFP
ncbi:MAG: hypothetical protein QM756_03450 [Polyangiaceae bacterium]